MLQQQLRSQVLQYRFLSSLVPKQQQRQQRQEQQQQENVKQEPPAMSLLHKDRHETTRDQCALMFWKA